ncbi:MAG TPA: hypothetical protein VLX30_05885 [Burkholderiales bacterium]|nr:hypothetical protein [Burkholderiales bacterium]
MREELERIDASIAAWEQKLAAGEPVALAPALEAASAAALALVRAYLAAEGGKPVPAEDADLLEAFKVLVKGDPSWNAIRDTLRELVYYRNCLALGRAEALPAVPQKMAIRLARHVYLYLRTRCLKEGRIAA